MNNELDTVTILLDDLPSTEFAWNGSDMSSGIIAQELSITYPSAYTSVQGATGTITINSAGPIGAVGSQPAILSGNSSYTISTPYEDMETRLAKLEKIIADEEEIRRTHPAVQTAYDHYRLLLVLAGKISPEDLEK